jgi:hypothetical protein
MNVIPVKLFVVTSIANWPSGIQVVRSEEASLFRIFDRLLDLERKSAIFGVNNASYLVANELRGILVCVWVDGNV